MGTERRCKLKDYILLFFTKRGLTKCEAKYFIFKVKTKAIYLRFIKSQLKSMNGETVVIYFVKNRVRKGTGPRADSGSTR